MVIRPAVHPAGRRRGQRGSASVGAFVAAFRSAASAYAYLLHVFAHSVTRLHGSAWDLLPAA